MRTSLLFLLIFLMLTPSDIVAKNITTQKLTPAFNCQQAKEQVEILICQDIQLANLDQLLNALYKELATQMPNTEFEFIKPVQRAWIKGRNDCWKAGEIKRCTIDAYHSRITELQIAVKEFEIPTVVQYKCAMAKNNNLSQITAYFYKETAIPAVMLSINPNSHQLKKNAIALMSRAASGGKISRTKLFILDS